jgi:O-antigen/teichoic acid export membrane protein
MISKDKNYLKTNMILSGISKPLSIIVSFIYVPIALNYLGVEKFGIWSTILSILSWISYFDIGIGNGLRNKLAEKIEKSIVESKILISTAYGFITVIISIVFILFLLIAKFLNWNEIFGVKTINENIFLIIAVSLTFLCINFVISLCKNVLYALQQAALVSWMEPSIQILNLILVLLVSKLLTQNLLAMAFIYGFSIVLVNFIASIILYRKHPDLKPNLHSFRFEAGKEITNLGMQFFVIQICALILFTTDNLIISRLYGASDVTPYTTVNKLFTAVSSVYLAFITPIWSSFTLAKSKDDYPWMRSILKKMHLLMLPFVIGTFILAFLFKDITFLWLQKNLVYEDGLIWLGAMYGLLTIWCNTYAVIGNGLGLMRVSMVTAIVQAVINIPLSLLFAISFDMKSSGVLLGTVISMSVSALVIPIFVIKYIYKNGERSR